MRQKRAREPTQDECGSLLFRLCRKVELTEQMRAAEDIEHTALLTKLRAFGPGNGGAALTPTMMRRYQPLSEEDCEDPSWRDATIVVAANPQRHAINKVQAARAAVATGVPVVQWHRPLEDALVAAMPPATLARLYELYPELTGIFVQGARGFLSRNMHPAKGLANGTPVRPLRTAACSQSHTPPYRPQVFLHSLCLSEEDKAAGKAEEIEHAGPGVVVTLLRPPRSINVEVPTVDAEQWPANENMAPAGAGIVVVPVTCEKSKASTSRRNGRELRYYNHHVILGYCVTYYKVGCCVVAAALGCLLPSPARAANTHRPAPPVPPLQVQGQTLDKIIVDLNQTAGNLKKVTYEAMYVALSRVRRSADIRLLPAVTGDAFAYVREMEGSPELSQWLAMFRGGRDTATGRPGPTPAAKKKKKERKRKARATKGATSVVPPARKRGRQGVAPGAQQVAATAVAAPKGARPGRRARRSLAAGLGPAPARLQSYKWLANSCHLDSVLELLYTVWSRRADLFAVGPLEIGTLRDHFVARSAACRRGAGAGLRDWLTQARNGVREELRLGLGGRRSSAMHAMWTILGNCASPRSAFYFRAGQGTRTCQACGHASRMRAGAAQGERVGVLERGGHVERAMTAAAGSPVSPLRLWAGLVRGGGIAPTGCKARGCGGQSCATLVDVVLPVCAVVQIPPPVNETCDREWGFADVGLDVGQYECVGVMCGDGTHYWVHVKVDGGWWAYDDNVADGVMQAMKGGEDGVLVLDDSQQPYIICCVYLRA
jgi:hypothetical protein